MWIAFRIFANVRSQFLICGVPFSRVSIHLFLRFPFSFFSLSAFPHILRHKIDKFLYWLFNRLLEPWMKRVLMPILFLSLSLSVQKHIFMCPWVSERLPLSTHVRNRWSERTTIAAKAVSQRGTGSWCNNVIYARDLRFENPSRCYWRENTGENTSRTRENVCFEIFLVGRLHV